MVNVTGTSAVAFLSVLMFSDALRTTPPAACGPEFAPHADTAIARVYRDGKTWEAFLADVDRRRELWNETWRTASVPEHLADRARSSGEWRVLIITVPGCSDSANSVPYIARLVEQTPGLELRLVDATMGRPWLEAHRSPDGRAATPTVLVLDGEFRIRGCWVEQPAALQTIWLPIVARGAASAELDRKMSWYAADAGREILREIVEVLEGARDGRPICPGMAAAGGSSPG
jgi:hypothetical protein